MKPTLYKHLLEKAPHLSELKDRYNPVLQLVDILIGTIPNSDVIMEIWPTSFRTYNLLVPNLLNLPFSLLGNKSIKKLVGLAMYQSSSAAECNYCTAHSCSFALRRGLNESTITGKINTKESAVINFSRNMAKIPCAITDDDFKKLQEHCNAKEIEAISMSIVMMGFLNKFMDVIGIELEQEAINDVTNVLKETTWETGKHFDGESKIKDNGRYLKKDSLLTYLKVFRQAPGAIRLENQWLKGTPKNNEKIHESLKEHTGHDFPILKKFNRVKLKRVMATALRENFTETNTNIGLRSKIICGVIFSVIIENTYLKDHLLILAENNKIKINPEFLKAIVESPVNDFDFDKQSLSKQETVAFAFTLQASNSPANIDESITKEVITHLTPASIVELTTWLSILQALHRLVKLPIS